MGRKCAHMKPYWAYIGTSKKRGQSSVSAAWEMIIFAVAFVLVLLYWLFSAIGRILNGGL